MFCENGISLVRESQSNMITIYNNKLVEEIIKEIQADTKKLVTMSTDFSLDKEDPAVKLSMKILFERVQRNKRCVLVYLNNRLDKFQKSAWESGNMIPNHIVNNMDDKDRKFYDDYNKILTTYSKKQSLIDIVDLDLTKDYTPPKDLYVEVRALEDFTLKEKRYATKIEKHQSYLLKRSEIEIYIRRGYFSINE